MFVAVWMINIDAFVYHADDDALVPVVVSHAPGALIRVMPYISFKARIVRYAPDAPDVVRFGVEHVGAGGDFRDGFERACGINRGEAQATHDL